MDPAIRTIDRIDRTIAGSMRRYSQPALRLSLAIVYIWFGILKPLGMSTASDMVARTVYWFDPEWFVGFLGWWEVTIGVCLLIRPLLRAAIFLLLLQMGGTFLPLVLLPEVCFERFPLVPTLEGQYVIKNLVIISAALAIGGSVREGGR